MEASISGCTKEIITYWEFMIDAVEDLHIDELHHCFAYFTLIRLTLIHIFLQVLLLPEFTVRCVEPILFKIEPCLGGINAATFDGLPGTV